MGVNNNLALRNSRLIRDYSLIDDRLRQLAYFVKYWARRRKINDPYRGTLSSYCYVLMLINFLQVQKYDCCLPVCHMLTIIFDIMLLSYVFGIASL
jgi:DNA polymerase sigma